MCGVTTMYNIVSSSMTMRSVSDVGWRASVLYCQMGVTLRACIGNSYEYLIARFASGAGKKAGEFYTPPEVSELLASLLDPQPNERICDPACGSGSLLIKCARHVGSSDFALYGQESNGSTWALAK